MNDTLRTGLSRSARKGVKKYTLRPAHLGGVAAGVTLDNALQLADHLEDIEIARKLKLRMLLNWEQAMTASPGPRH